MCDVYVSPCYPCEFNHYAIDEEFGDCLYDRCSCPDPDNLCWIVKWINESHPQYLVKKDSIQSDAGHCDE